MPKRTVGVKEGRGKTKGDILGYILKNPQGITEEQILSYLREKSNISESRGIKKHLSDLDKYLHKKQDPGKPGNPNVWFIRYDFVTLRSLVANIRYW